MDHVKRFLLATNRLREFIASPASRLVGMSLEEEKANPFIRSKESSRGVSIQIERD
jgi:hypothetical protein